MKNPLITLTIRFLLLFISLLSAASPELFAQRGLSVTRPGSMTLECDGTYGTYNFAVSAANKIKITFSGRGDANADTVLCSLRFNGDSGLHYSYHTSPYGSPTPGGTPIPTPTPYPLQTGIWFGLIPAANYTAGYVLSASAIIDSPSPDGNAGFYKTVTVTNSDNSMSWTGFWASGAPIDHVSLTLASGNFAKGSMIICTWE